MSRVEDFEEEWEVEKEDWDLDTKDKTIENVWKLIRLKELLKFKFKSLFQKLLKDS